MKLLNGEFYIVGSFWFIDSDGIVVNGLVKLVNGEFKLVYWFLQWSYINCNIVSVMEVYKNKLYVVGVFVDDYLCDMMWYICEWNGIDW